MKILLFGKSGQLGSEVVTRASELSFHIVSPVASELNITEREDVIHLIEQVTPEVIINCAAYTAVDDAETNRDLAFLVNAEGPRNVADGARRIGARLIHISTDYVFDGSSNTPLTEECRTAPINVYGESKLAGEHAIQEVLSDRAIIVRTSSLHGQHGENFVHTMLRLFEERTELSIVDDQYMSPTWAGWLAGVVLDLCRIDQSQIEGSGVIHACGSGGITWYDFAEAILALSTSGGDTQQVELKRVSADTFKRPAGRPTYSVMSCEKLTKTIGRAPISWIQGLEGHLSDIGRLKEEIEEEKKTRNRGELA